MHHLWLSFLGKFVHDTTTELRTQNQENLKKTTEKDVNQPQEILFCPSIHKKVPTLKTNLPKQFFEVVF